MPTAQRRAHVLSEEEQARALSIIRTRSRYPIRDLTIFAFSHGAGLRVGEIAELNVGDAYEVTARAELSISKTASKRPHKRAASVIKGGDSGPKAMSGTSYMGAELDFYKTRAETTLTKTKGDKPRVVYLDSPLLAKALGQYLSSRVAIKARRCAEVPIEQQPLFLTQKGNRFNTSTMCQLFQRIYGSGWADVKNAKGHSGRRTFITNLAEQGYNLKAIAQLAGHSSIQTTAIYIDTNPLQLKRMAASATSSKLERLL